MFELILINDLNKEESDLLFKIDLSVSSLMEFAKISESVFSFNKLLVILVLFTLIKFLRTLESNVLLVVALICSFRISDATFIILSLNDAVSTDFK